MIPEWVPAGAWAAMRVGSRVFTNWVVIAITFVPLFVFALVIWRVLTRTRTNRFVITVHDSLAS